MRSFIFSERALLVPRFRGAAATGRVVGDGRGAWQYGQPLFISWLHSVIGRISLTPAYPDLALMKDINAAFNSRDIDRVMTFFADGCTFLKARRPAAGGPPV